MSKASASSPARRRTAGRVLSTWPSMVEPLVVRNAKMDRASVTFRGRCR